MNKLSTRSIFIFVLTIFLTPVSSFSQWIQTNSPSGGVVEALAVSGGYLVAGTYGGGTYRTKDNGTTWTQVNPGLQNTNVNALAVSDTNLYAGTFGGVYRSVNNAATWNSTGLSFNNLVQALTGSGKKLLAGTLNGAFLSPDNGSSWTAINNGLTNMSITAVAISDTNLYAGTETGIYRAPVNGSTWIAINTGLSNSVISSLILNGLYILAGTNSGVYLTATKGASWSQVYTGLGNGSVEALLAIGSDLFAAVRGNGVFRLDTNAKIWVNTGMPEVNVFSLAVQNNYLFVGTGTSVWRRPLSEILTKVSDFQESSGNLTLFQNYPNPFRSTTGIEYSLKAPDHVTLTVYDMQGQQVELLVNEVKSAGRYCILFESSCLPAGTYYCRLKVGNQMETVKMTKMEK